MYFDGSQLVNTSTDLRSSLLAEALTNVGDNGVDGGQAIAGRLPNGYLGLSVGLSPSTVASSEIAFSAFYHAPRGAWAGFSSDALSAGRPIGFGRALSKSYIVDDQRIFAADAVTAPEASIESERGVDNNTPLFTFDSSGSGPLFNGTANTLKNQLTTTSAWTAGDGVAIPAVWHSRLAKLAAPTNLATIRRLLFDYTFHVDGGSDDNPDGWLVELVDGMGNVLMSSRAVPTQGDPGTHAYRRQYSADIFAEAADAQLRVSWTSPTPPAPALVEASALSAYLTFLPASERGSL
jgi:hypothetical protein